MCKQRENKLKIEEMLNIGKRPATCYICPHISVRLFLRVFVVSVCECGFQWGRWLQLCLLSSPSWWQRHPAKGCTTGQLKSQQSTRVWINISGLVQVILGDRSLTSEIHSTWCLPTTYTHLSTKIRCLSCSRLCTDAICAVLPSLVSGSATQTIYILHDYQKGYKPSI